MTILALDTATRTGGVALWIDGVVHVGPADTTRTHGERLPGAALDLLRAHGRSIGDVDVFAVVAGPGSFTGLRIGIASIQGMALATGKRVVAVPTLEAIRDGWRSRALPDRSTLVVAWMDGQRGDVFFAGWRLTPGVARPDPAIEARVGRPDDLFGEARVAAHGGPVVLVSTTAASRDLTIDAGLPGIRTEQIDTPLVVIAAETAARRADDAVAPHALRPIYLRRPDAVLARDRLRLAEGIGASAPGPTPADAPGHHPGPLAAPDLVVTAAGPDDDLSEVEALQGRAFTNPWRADAIRWELTHSDVARLYLARATGGAVVAYCACWLVFDELHLNSLAVDQDWRRRGVARRLLDHVFRDAIASGARSATLEVRRSNEAALALYRGLGFEVEAVRREYYQSPREDALILWNRHLAAPPG